MRELFDTIFGYMKPIEIAAAVTSLICVWLTVRNNIWNWAWGLIGVSLYGWIFYTQGLYANAALQIIYYVPIQFIGFYVWLRFGPKRDDDLPVTVLTNRARLLWAAFTLAMTGLFYWFFRAGITLIWPRLPPDPQPLLDGVTTAVSITAQYLQVPKRFENWILWCAVDIVYIPMFLLQKPKPLYVTALLYAIFTALAVAGIVDWLKILRSQEEAAARTSDAGTVAVQGRVTRP